LTVRPFETRDGEPITWADGNSWAIPAESQDKAAACAFIRAMTEKDAWLAAAEARAQTAKKENQPNTGVYTGNREADEEIFANLDLGEWPWLEEAVQVVRDVQEHAWSLPPSPASAQFENAYKAAGDEVMNQGTDAEQVLTQADERVQREIDRAAR